MSGAEGVLIVNICVGALFAAGYATLAFANPSQRPALGFAGNYVLGLLAPIADLMTPRLGAPVLTEWVGYLAFLVGTASISITYPMFHGKPGPWRAVTAVIGFGVGAHAVIGSQPQDTLVYGLAYQLPFALAAILAARTVLSLHVAGRPLAVALGVVFSLIALLHLTKPFMALAMGPGTLENYAQTAYALVSQVSSGILLLAAGMLLLLIVAQKAITESQVASETDPLSGLLNRRGFDRRARPLVAAAEASGRPLAAAVFDLDHFKHVNDRFGHDTGDAVIAAAAEVLGLGAPQDALACRMGGEEFALLLPGLAPFDARRRMEQLRTRLAERSDDLPPVTASCGLAHRQPGETLADLMRRVDLAAYDAKRAGRDRLRVWEEREGGDAAVVGWVRIAR
ncbi:diguanylate cyclase [Phenylobacterium sp.]|uniref:GGDEF domain-containing protein n=1 Tax=Phenylobacterium sp. TaxID=1871053 RepID=UPI0025F18EAE|nr:GGDEF domain-containing protein [Phenylobacterium sp.]MBX3483425.1 GGDEF domain-containing protein [Phenylobacterium sp.]MCW5759447.1 GGDEF domain-containing protein [Phenylobacterium sp.]